MMEGQPSLLYHQFIYALASSKLALLTIERRRCGKSTAIARIARDLAKQGRRVLVLVTSLRDVDSMMVDVGFSPLVACSSTGEIAASFQPECILIDEAGHMDPSIFFRRIVPILQMRRNIRMLCIGENRGLMLALNGIQGPLFHRTAL